MKKNEVDSLRWNQYQLSVDIPEELMEEMIHIVDSIGTRKTDVVNWEERRAMDEATRRSGHVIHSGENMTAEEMESAQQVDETAGASSEKERELMSDFGGILKELEQLNEGQK